MSLIVFVRHGESVGNEAELLTGLMDAPLTRAGKLEAQAAGKQLRHLTFDSAYTSRLRRAQDTLNEIIHQIEQPTIPITITPALDERDFGTLTGMPKSALQSSLGETDYKTIVKGWDTPAPEGESLRMVQARALPYFQTKILADARAQKNILVVSHHQTLRALLKYIQNISDNAIERFALKNAWPIAYQFNPKTDSLTQISL